MFTQKEIQLSDSPITKEATIIRNEDVPAKSAILYLHGGGLIFGERDDLPNYHLQRLTDEGHVIITIDYLLAPATKLPEILEDLQGSLSTILDKFEEWLGQDIPYFLWGRSAGAFLSLWLGGKGNLTPPPQGVISFYGYGFLADNWYESKNDYFNKTYPALDATWLDQASDEPTVEGDPRDTMGIYIYARQSGTWKELVYGEDDSHFLDRYSLRDLETYPVPLFLTHATGDYDVPYEEFQALVEKYEATTFVVESQEHDYDRNTAIEETVDLLDKMIAFLDEQID